jgi:hypothetical protein
VVRDCDTEPYAASAREKAIVCLTDTRPRCNRNVRIDGNARAKRRNLGNTVDCLTVSRRPVAALTRSPESRHRRRRVRTPMAALASIGERWPDILAQAGEAKAHTLPVI